MASATGTSLFLFSVAAGSAGTACKQVESFWREGRETARSACQFETARPVCVEGELAGKGRWGPRVRAGHAARTGW